MPMFFSVSPAEDAPRSDYTVAHDVKTVKQSVVAFRGKCVVMAEAEDIPGSRPFKSAVLENPTWGKMLRVAARCQRYTKDEHHCYLEGVRAVGTADFGGVEATVLRLSLGS